MIHSLLGNSSISSARVFCMSDYHCDPTQKFIRAQIINEICALKKDPRTVIFLLESQEYGVEASKEACEGLVGTDLIHATFSAYGWDNMDLHQKGIKLIRRAHRLVKKQISLKKKSQKFGKKLIEYFDPKLKKKGLETRLERISKKINILFSEISRIAIARNQSLYHAINYIIDRSADVDVYVVAGGKHFDHISTALKSIPHCVINLKKRKIQNWEEWEKCVQDMYYPASSSSRAGKSLGCR